MLPPVLNTVSNERSINLIIDDTTCCTIWVICARTDHYLALYFHTGPPFPNPTPYFYKCKNSWLQNVRKSTKGRITGQIYLPADPRGSPVGVCVANHPMYFLQRLPARESDSKFIRSPRAIYHFIIGPDLWVLPWSIPENILSSRVSSYVQITGEVGRNDLLTPSESSDRASRGKTSQWCTPMTYVRERTAQ